MAKEIERKYLVDKALFEIEVNKLLEKGVKILSQDIKQAYLNNSSDWIVRVDLYGNVFISSELADLSIKAEFNNEDVEQLFNHESSKGRVDEGGVLTIDEKAWVARIRIYDNSDAEFCLKERVSGEERGECECNIDLYHAHDMFNSVDDKIDKTRYKFPFNSYFWDIDLFLGSNQGLATGELETSDKNYEKPNFIKVEVTDDSRLYNDNLSRKPLIVWKDEFERDYGKN